MSDLLWLIGFLVVFVLVIPVAFPLAELYGDYCEWVWGKMGWP